MEDNEESSIASSGTRSEKDLPDAIRATAVAINLCLANKFLKARSKLEPWAHESMYHALGYGTISFIQAVLTFEQQDIEQACDSIKQALDVCDRYKRKQSWSESISQFFWNPSFEDLTEEERHAELCYAECLLQRALLTFIQDDNLISFIKGGLKIRSCHQSYKTCQAMITSRSAALQQSAQKVDFEGGVYMGIGSFNLLLSLLPSKILKLLEWIGFSGDKYYGLEQLEKGCKTQSLRSPMCAMVLLAYHTVVSYYLGIGDGDIALAEEIIEPFLKAFPKGAIFLYYAGRTKQVQGKLDQAIQRYNDSISTQMEWKQFHHICYWELMWCFSLENNWAKAYHYVAILQKESRWSKTVYMYQKAAFRVMARETNQEIPKEIDCGEKDSEEYLFRHLPDFKQRIAGKSIPFEKFAVHKSQKYFKQDKRLFLPGLELVYVWNGFRVLQHRPELARPLLELVHRAQVQLEQFKDGELYVDDWCLGKLLEGMCYKSMEQPQDAMKCLSAALERSSEIVSDHYLAPFTCAEIGFLYLDQDNLQKAKFYFKNTRKEYQRYHLENRLLFRIHAAQEEIKRRQRQRGERDSSSLEVTEGHSHSSDIPRDADESGDECNWETASEDSDGDDDDDFVDAEDIRSHSDISVTQSSECRVTPVKSGLVNPASTVCSNGVIVCDPSSTKVTQSLNDVAQSSIEDAKSGTNVTQSDNCDDQSAAVAKQSNKGAKQSKKWMSLPKKPFKRKSKADTSLQNSPPDDSKTRDFVVKETSL